MGNEILLRVQNLKTNFVTWKGVVTALDGVDFDIYKGETMGLVGETGCGKSVTALSIMGLVPPTQGAIVGGHIVFDGSELTRNVGKDVRIVRRFKKFRVRVQRRIYRSDQTFLNKFRGTKIAMIFQEPMTSLNPVANVATQITELITIRLRSELARRILSRLTIEKEKFEEIKESILTKNESKLTEYSKDPLKAALVEQILSIYRRTDLSLLDKNKEIDNLHNIKPLGKAYTNSLQAISNGKNGFFGRLPLVKNSMNRQLTREAERKAVEVLKSLNIFDAEQIIRAYPHELSGGMKQRVMIGISLIGDPELLIADEPTTALDVTTQAQILDLLKDLKKRRSLSILFITHDLGVVSDIADRIAVMYAGGVVELGEKMQIFYNPKHPYTQGLLRSIPTEENMRMKLNTIQGSIPNMLDPPSGCKFNPRCEFVMEICRAKIPMMREIEPGHSAACWLYEMGDKSGK